MLTSFLFAESAFIKFVTHDTLFAVVLFTMTFIGAVLVVWRLWLNYNAKTDLNMFLPKFQEILNKEGIDGAMKFCKAQPKNEYIPSTLFVAALEKQRDGLAAMRKSMANAVKLEILPALNFLLPTILAFAKIATMVGLLFTIISMIGTFSALKYRSKCSADSGLQRCNQPTNPARNSPPPPSGRSLCGGPERRA